MAILHIEEIRKMKQEDLDKRVVDLRKELLRARTQISQGTPPDNPGRVREIRKTLARIETLKNERGQK